MLLKEVLVGDAHEGHRKAEGKEGRGVEGGEVMWRGSC